MKIYRTAEALPSSAPGVLHAIKGSRKNTPLACAVTCPGCGNPAAANVTDSRGAVVLSRQTVRRRRTCRSCRHRFTTFELSADHLVAIIEQNDELRRSLRRVLEGKGMK